MKLFITRLQLVVYSLIVFTVARAQVGAPSATLKDQAGKMGQAFVREDYKTFEQYMYPPLVAIMGGPMKVQEVLAKTITDMKTTGMSFTSISVGNASAIVKAGKELQATILQHTELKTGRGRIVVTSTLIAVSDDRGVSWSFIDTSNKDLATIKKLIPGLSPDITLPPPTAPQTFNN